MKMKIKRLFTLFGSICFMVVFLMLYFMPAPAHAGQTKHPIPPLVKLGTHEVGTGGYLQAGIACESIIEKYGNKIRAVPNGVEFARSRVGQLGTVDLIFHSSTQYYPLQEGIFGYDTPDWGPQPIRAVFMGEHQGMAFAVRGNSDIKTMADLRGKKVAYFPGGPGTTWRLGAKLWFAKLTWKDVIPVPFTSPSKGYSAAIDGKIDTCYFNVGASKAYEFASMPSGMRFIPLPFADKEGWARIWEKCPPVTQRLADVGAGGISDKNPLECIGMVYPAFIAWPKADPEIIYFMAKAFRETYPSYAGKNKAMKRLWKPEIFWRLWESPPGIIPLHEGAIQYYKEIGEWNAKREQIQQKRLQHQAALKKLWVETMKEAKKQGIKTKEIPAFWMKKRAAAGFYVPDPLPK
jgi:TRAP transporter TAXI family solute receptor